VPWSRTRGGNEIVLRLRQLLVLAVKIGEASVVLDVGRVTTPLLRVVPHEDHMFGLVPHKHHVAGAFSHENWNVWFERGREGWGGGRKGWGGGGREEGRREVAWSAAAVVVSTFLLLLSPAQPLAHSMDGDDSEICHAKKGDTQDYAEAEANEAAGDGEESEDCVDDPCKEVVDGVEEVVEEVVDGGGGGEKKASS